MVPLSGNELVSAARIEELKMVKFAPVVVATVKNEDASVSVKDVTDASIPPLSFSVVCAYPTLSPPQRPAPKPVPDTATLRPVLI